MALDSSIATAESLQIEACRFYSALTRGAAALGVSSPGAEPNLGGNLLYIGQLDAHGSAKVIAGNVAGCATLSATADSAAQKQAIRDGAVDFVVTSLDEALRILKNEIRKKATAAVCVGLAPSAVEREMSERGVVPDLVSADSSTPQFGINAREVQSAPADHNQVFVEWTVEEAPLRWMPRLDAIALECLQSDPWARRWIRLSPRYCGRSARGQRALCCDSNSAKRIVDEFGTAIRGGTIGTEVSARLIIDGALNVLRLSLSGAN